jgi:hypothetical protein
VRESCYCGRVGEVEDREPVWRDGRTEALRCRRCGHLDALPCLDDAARRSVFEEAERRSLEGLAEGTRTGHGRGSADRTGTLGERWRPRSV